jgi:hypothetical protein
MSFPAGKNDSIELMNKQKFTFDRKRMGRYEENAGIWTSIKGI